MAGEQADGTPVTTFLAVVHAAAAGQAMMDRQDSRTPQRPFAVQLTCN